MHKRIAEAPDLSRNIRHLFHDLFYLGQAYDLSPPRYTLYIRVMLIIQFMWLMN